MNELQQIAYVQAQVACALIELEARKVANEERRARGEALAYAEEGFRDIVRNLGIDHNSVLETLRGGA